MRAKWKTTIGSIDLGDTMPLESDLMPHDYRLEDWAGGVLFGLLNDLVGLYQEQAMDAIVERGKATNGRELVMANARIAAERAHIEIAKQLRDNMRVERD